MPTSPRRDLHLSAEKRSQWRGVLCHAPGEFDGAIIDKFHFVVKDGKIVEAHAEKGGGSEAAISVDEGACYFGEVALVPYDSPISNQKILFYNTLLTRMPPAISLSVRRTPAWRAASE